MSAPRDNPQNSGGSHAATWITVMVAAPLMYLLTLPAVVAMAVPSGSPAPSPPKWIEIYVTPVVWLFEFEAFTEVYWPYYDWCWKTVLRRTGHV